MSLIPGITIERSKQLYDHFDNLSDLKELAVGSGAGLRYDFNFFVLRLDVGFKTHNPAQIKGKRWLNDFTLKKAVYNIGINYPF